jgi:2-phosphoglycolate phosphatase
VTARGLARALLLDLDGTLLDTAPDMAAALNALRRAEGAAPLPFAAIRPHVSHGARALVQLGFGAVEPERHEALRLRFLALYRERLSDSTQLFAGWEAVLARLEAGALPWGIVTNKPGWLTAPLLVAVGLAARAGCVVAGDTLPERKPHPAPLLHAAALLGHAPQACLYAGDAERDIIAGRAAGMRTLAMRFGYLAAHEDPARWQPDAVASEPADVLDWLELP